MSERIEFTRGQSLGGMGKVIAMKRNGVVVDTWAMHIDPWPSREFTVAALDALEAAESENQRLRSALIEAQSWIEGDKALYRNPSADFLSSIRAALEGQ
jgi:hypothetical protein